MHCCKNLDNRMCSVSRKQRADISGVDLKRSEIISDNYIMSDCALPLETEIEKIMFFIGVKDIENHQKEED